MKNKIFAIDDERDIQEIIKVNLEKEGYEVNTFSSADLAEKHMKKGNIPDLIILDIMMQGTDGYEFCKRLKSVKEYASIPVMFLSAKTEEFDKVLGFELGGDDYMTKPFGVRELKARVKAHLRRTETLHAKETQVLRYKGVELYPEQYALSIDGSSVDLTKTEFFILRIFLENPGKIFSRDNIIDSVRGQDAYVVDRTIDVHIMNLRKKLGPYKNIIRTFSGVGYGFKE
ncbi:MAG: response regulator transcription factor [Spirochaetes bacterium]|jgi:DNA-binding response OmpR family regulator|nr:response regulator transcription factor [Spirochaetota bacterium]